MVNKQYQLWDRYGHTPLLCISIIKQFNCGVGMATHRYFVSVSLNNIKCGVGMTTHPYSESVSLNNTNCEVGMAHTPLFGISIIKQYQLWGRYAPQTVTLDPKMVQNYSFPCILYIDLKGIHLFHLIDL